MKYSVSLLTCVMSIFASTLAVAQTGGGGFTVESASGGASSIRKVQFASGAFTTISSTSPIKTSTGTAIKYVTSIARGPVGGSSVLIYGYGDYNSNYPGLLSLTWNSTSTVMTSQIALSNLPNSKSKIYNIEYVPSLSTLYAIADTDTLITIDPSTGIASTVNLHVNGSHTIEGLSYDSSGNLYAFTTTSPTNIIQFSPSTGTISNTWSYYGTIPAGVPCMFVDSSSGYYMSLNGASTTYTNNTIAPHSGSYVSGSLSSTIPNQVTDCTQTTGM